LPVGRRVRGIIRLESIEDIPGGVQLDLAHHGGV
jgi:hypothetical protein